jgi:hypothetical protein
MLDLQSTKKQNTNKKSLKIYTDSLPLKKGYIPSPNRNKKSHNINMGSTIVNKCS